MRIPKELIIAGHTIKIEYKEGLVADGKECWGVYEDSKHTIFLRRGMDKTRHQEILLHEILHVIEQVYVLSGLNEKNIKILGVEILAAIRNNKLKFK